MKNFKLILALTLFSCTSTSKVNIINKEKEKTWNVLLVSFVGDNKSIFYNPDHFHFPCVKFEKQIIYDRIAFNKILSSKDKKDLVFVENNKHEFKNIEKLLPYNDVEYKLKLDGGNHCYGVSKIFLKKGETIDEVIKLDKYFLKLNQDDKKIRLHFIYKDTIDNFHAVSNWFDVKE